MDWPRVTYADIYNYLIHTPSQYTHETLKAYKSMEGYTLYNYFINGWVSNISVRRMESSTRHYVFTAMVKHSQSLSAPPLKVWVGFRYNGEVLCAHCTCMAGVGEACSQIAAVLLLLRQTPSSDSTSHVPHYHVPGCNRISKM